MKRPLNRLVMRKLNVLLFIAICFALAPNSAHSQQIYKWTDEFGVAHYGTTPPESGGEVPKLPAVVRENIDSRIEEIKDQTPPNCSQHGGVDCSKGRDEDGSVLCSDGFKEAAVPFQTACTQAKISLQPPSIVGENGEVLGELNDLSKVANLNPHSIKFLIRNNSGASATGVVLEFIIPGEQRFEAIGPAEVEPFAAAEYIVHLKSIALSYPLEGLKRFKVRVECTNCGVPIVLVSKRR